MFQVSILEADKQQRTEVIENTGAMIGKGRECHIRLAGWRIGREHARVFRTKTGLFIQDLGQFHGTWVNGARIGQHGPIAVSDEIVLGPYTLKFEDKLELPAQDLAIAEPAGRTSYAAHGVKSVAQVPTMTPHHFWRKRIHEQLLEAIDMRRRDLLRMEDKELRSETEALILEIVKHEPALPDGLDQERLVRDVLNEAVGLGPLEELLDDDSITEIMVNRFDEIYLERAGQLERHPSIFTSDRAVLGVIERIVAPLGRRIDESSPMVDARLKDGSRVNAVIPPLALKGPTLTIRKFSRRALGAQDLIDFGAISPNMAEFLRLCVLHRKNIIISGGTGSGKTTLLNVLSNFIPDGERVITIEDAAELRLGHSHLISLEARPSNAEGRGLVTIRDLVKNALRMRPDRIVVGECRGGEALDMLQAMNTGHEGSLTTLHANNPRDALARLETLVLMAGMDLPLTAIREHVVSAIDIIVQQARLSDGRRVVTSIVEIAGLESGTVQMQDLFKFEQHSRHKDGRIEGRFSACDVTPAFYEDLAQSGIRLDLSLFNRDQA